MSGVDALGLLLGPRPLRRGARGISVRVNLLLPAAPRLVHLLETGPAGDSQDVVRIIHIG
jgi:hypothetical protein